MAGALALVFFGGGGFTDSRVATVVLAPVADGILWELNASMTRGLETTLIAGTTGVFAGNSRSRAGLRFEVSGVIPAGATVRSAALTVKVVKVPSGGADSTFELRRILQPWDEATVSWNQRSAADAWSVPGAAAGTDFSATVSATVAVSGLNSYVFTANAGLVADVQAWVDSPGTNFGWMLLSQAEPTGKTARHFGAREALDASVPALSITFDPPAIPPTLTVLPGNNAGLRFSFSAEANRSYVVETRDFLGPERDSPHSRLRWC